VYQPHMKHHLTLFPSWGLYPYIEYILGDYQYGFWCDTAASVHIFCIHHITNSIEHSSWEAEEAKRTICNNLVFSFNKISAMLVNKLECSLLTGDTTSDEVHQGSPCLGPTGKLLILDPNKTWYSYYAMDHNFFWNDPLPCELFKMLAQHTQSICQYKASVCRPGHIHQHHHHEGGASTAAGRVSDTYSNYQDRIYICIFI
jgi:hypothetical protein